MNRQVASRRTDPHKNSCLIDGNVPNVPVQRLSISSLSRSCRATAKTASKVDAHFTFHKCLATISIHSLAVTTICRISMGFEVVLDSNSFEALSGRMTSASTEFSTGLVIGCMSSANRYLICGFVPTPSPPPGMKVIGALWVGQHAKFVRKYLVGGCSVLGAFAYGTSDALKARSQQTRDAAIAAGLRGSFITLHIESGAAAKMNATVVQDPQGVR